MSVPQNADLSIVSQAEADRHKMVTDNNDAQGVKAFVTNPDSNYAFSHPKVLQLSADTANNDAVLAYRLLVVESGGKAKTPDFDWHSGVFSTGSNLRVTHDGSYYYQFRTMWDVGSSGSLPEGTTIIELLEMYSTAESAIAAVQKIAFYIQKSSGVNHLVCKLAEPNFGYEKPDELLQNGVWYDIRMKYKPETGSSANGILFVQQKLASADTWVTLIDVTNHTQNADIMWVEYQHLASSGSSAGGTSSKTWIASSYQRLDGFEADDYEYNRFRTSTCMDVSSSVAKIRVHCDDETIDTSSGGFIVQYGTNATLSSGVSDSSYTAFSARTHDCATVSLTSLSADTRYYYRVKFQDDESSPTNTYTSPEIRSFKTLATATGGTRKILIGGCRGHAGWRGGNAAFDHLIAIEGTPDMMLFNGDMIYDTDLTELGSGNSDYELWGLTETNYSSAYRLSFGEYDFAKILSGCAFFGMCEDHEFFNSSDGNMRGQAVNMGLAVDNAGVAYPTSHMNTTYLNGGGSPVTADDVFTLATDVMASWWGNGTIGAADSGSGRDYYRSFEHGNVLVLMLDTRTRSTATKLITSTQETWIQTTIAASSAKYIIISSPASWGDYLINISPAEAWGSNASLRAQRTSIFNWIKNNASDRVVYLIGGDRHAPYVAYPSDLTGPDGPLKLIAMASPFSQMNHYNTSDITAMASDPSVVSVIDTDDYDGLSMVRTSGLLVCIDEATDTVRLVMYDDNGNMLIDESDSYVESIDSGETFRAISATTAPSHIPSPTFTLGGDSYATRFIDPNIESMIERPSFNSPVTISFEEVASDYEIRYTTSNRNPTSGSRLYSEPIVLTRNRTGSDNTVIKARIFHKNNPNIRSRITRLDFNVIM